MDSPLAISGKRNSNRGEERNLIFASISRSTPMHAPLVEFYTFTPPSISSSCKSKHASWHPTESSKAGRQATLDKRRMSVLNAGNLEPEFEGVLQFADRGASNSSPPVPRIALAVVCLSREATVPSFHSLKKKDVECHKSRGRYPRCRD